MGRCFTAFNGASNQKSFKDLKFRPNKSSAYQSCARFSLENVRVNLIFKKPPYDYDCSEVAAGEGSEGGAAPMV
jgi:hypothetical protein